MEELTNITSRVIALPAENIDTDQIIPARFLVTTDREGFADALFADWRLDESGRPRPGTPWADPRLADAAVLLAGRNVGCGSSREHAAWALIDYGIRVVISTELADIFRANALRNGLLAVDIDRLSHAELLAAVKEDPLEEVAIDLEAQSILMPGGREVSFALDPFAKHCLRHGVDQLGYLLERAPAVAAWEAENPPRVDTQRSLTR